MKSNQKKPIRKAIALTMAIGLTSAVGSACSQSFNHQDPKIERKQIMTMKEDLENRSTEIHWPEGFSPADADLFSHNELFINASCEQVWSHIIDASKWPAWYPNSKDVRLLNGDTTLTATSIFRWETFGLPLESKVNEFVPFERLGWFGYAPNTAPAFYHTWYLKPSANGCLVMTDEVGRGAGAAAFRDADEGAMHRGHDLWLATLKWVSERK